ncbi:MAG TPA: SIMPL domain-containing protein [Solirubrobacteraceae bacterium]|nr:SIMPL domain-containing protein [Solirubrobacteraceae bacterium]
MIRSRAALAVAACLAGVAAGSIGAAQADTGSTGATGASGAAATITVNGSATAALPTGASSDTINTTYLSALSSALTAAHTKATALSAAVGDKLGAVQNITEQSNNSGLCSGPIAFAKGAPSVAPGPAHKKHGHHGSKTKGATARMADANGTCTLEADITVTYAMAPA